jgi:hypothetical protein
MKFAATSTLDNFVKSNTRGSKYVLFANIVMFLLVGLGFRNKTTSEIEFALTLIVIGVITLIATYQTTYKTAQKINLIVKSVSVEDQITICTYGYGFLFFRLSPIVKQFDKSTIIIKGDMPMYTGSLKAPQVYILKLDEVEFYVFYKYFDDDLMEQIK